MGFSKKEAPDCDRCPFKKNCFYNLLDDRSSQKHWKEMRVANRFRPGEVVFYEGEKPQGLFVVCTGRVKVNKTSRAGQQLVTRIESPGDLLGQRSMLAHENYSANAETMTESVVSMVDEAAFIQFLLEHPRASLALLRELSKDVRRGEDAARDIAFKPARARLSSVLLKMMTPKSGGPPSVSGLKRRDLADMAGLTVETTVRLLKDFEGRGFLQRRDKSLLISDEPKLRAVADRSY